MYKWFKTNRPIFILLAVIVLIWIYQITEGESMTAGRYGYVRSCLSVNVPEQIRNSQRGNYCQCVKNGDSKVSQNYIEKQCLEKYRP
ncbi:hypothetical protein GCM10023206_16590 [Acinetobacter puyangensis]|uniref:Uncharacterized protein n=1 Tax=Acinetobacter puyangensis TaxID=1096779 RepID=A0A240E5P3_9GAMM|nr:hypothetical protein SAMN05421731_102237 [Acinetobacter puyangensis]